MNTTLGRAFAGANQAQFGILAEGVAKAYQPQFGILAEGVAKAYQPQLASPARIFAGANQAQLASLAQSVAKAYPSQLGILAQGVVKAHQSQLASLAEGVAKLFDAQLIGFAQAVTGSHHAQFAGLSDLARGLPTMPITDAMVLQISNFVAELAKADFAGVAPKQGSENRELRKLSDREAAAMVTTIVFLLVYFSLGLAIKYSPQIAQIAAIYGPTPFDAAMAVGALTFWFWMNHHRES